MKVTPPSPCWSGRAPTWKTGSSHSMLRLPSLALGNFFTTHTAVEAGFDRFAPGLIEQYLGKYAEEKLSISVDESFYRSGGAIATTHLSRSIWPISPSAAAVPLTASANCTVR